MSGANDDADCLIVDTAIENVIVVGEDTDLLVLHLDKFITQLLNITFKSDVRRLSAKQGFSPLNNRGRNSALSHLKIRSFFSKIDSGISQIVNQKNS